PAQVVISGAESEVERVGAELQREGVETKRLVVSHAFHSPLMAPMVEEFRKVAESVTYAEPRIALVANAYGREAKEEIATAEYWVRHILAPVRFGEGMATLSKRSITSFVEIGPRALLLLPAEACVGENEAAWLCSMEKERDDGETIRKSLGELYVRGAPVNWKAACPGRRVSLPTYPFERERYWIESRPGWRSGDGQQHPLLGVRIPLVGDLTVFDNALAADTPAFLRDHQVFGRTVVPGTALVEMARAAADQVFGEGAHEVQGAVLQQALILPEEGARRVQLHARPEDEDTGSFSICSEGNGAKDKSFIVQATGRMVRGTGDANWGRTDLDALRGRCTRAVDVEALYEGIRLAGITYGPAHQGIRELWHGKGEALARLELPVELNETSREYPIHPALLDAAMQVLGAASHEAMGGVHLPFEFERLRCREALGEIWVHAALGEGVAGNAEVMRGEVSLYDGSGASLGNIRLSSKRADAAALSMKEMVPLEKSLFVVEW